MRATITIRLPVEIEFPPRGQAVDLALRIGPVRDKPRPAAELRAASEPQPEGDA